MKYPTIINEIKPEKNIYDLSLENYAKIDNTLAAAQLAIGESSNVAQLCLTYSYNFEDEKYYDNVCILAILAQIAIDNAKRKFDVDLTGEIARIKKLVDIDNNGLPAFWLLTKKDKLKAKSDEERKEKRTNNKQRILKKMNNDLKCPMNKLVKLDVPKIRDTHETVPNKYFLKQNIQNTNRRKSKKVEELIQKYSLDLLRFYTNCDWEEDRDALFVLEDRFYELIEEIKTMYVSENYIELMSWLIKRAFCIDRTHKNMQSNTHRNKAILIKILYTINPKCFLACFDGYENYVYNQSKHNQQNSLI